MGCDTASACPVDENTRSAWLRAAQSNAATATPAPQPSLECSSDRISQSPVVPSNLPPARRPLSTDREVSSIPRSFSDEQQQQKKQTHTYPATAATTPQTPPKSKPALPANAEQETGPHSSGNWIYPSESQFYHAVLAKNTASSPDALLASISHIVPIHNAVNERAWALIKAKATPSTPAAPCTGPKLHSFHGRGAGALTPRAKWNSWVLGYKTPFDRHDWVIERCDGQKVEYVIDFYEGKSAAGAATTTANTSTKTQRHGAPSPPQANLNFYLDVRPKLNTWEGWRMRIEKGLGVK
ncbi:hypothetical protein DV735_g4764, partial [Chaetothyriales sp. CBS 134920]